MDQILMSNRFKILMKTQWTTLWAPLRMELDTRPPMADNATHPSTVHSEQTHITIPIRHQLGLKTIIKDMKHKPNNHITVHNLATTKMQEKLKDLRSSKHLNQATCMATETNSIS